MKTNGVRVKKGQAVLAGRVLGALVLGGLWTVTAGNQVEAARDYSNLQDLGKVTLVEEKKEPVVVQAEPETAAEDTYAGGQVSRKSSIGVLGKKDFMEVPFNVISISEETMQNQQASNIIDVVANDSSVTDLTLSGASNAWSIRGFKTTQQDVQLNGIYGVAPRYYTGIEYLENVEILKGPSAMLSGMAPNDTVGGVINYVTKHAGDEDKNTVTLTYGEGHQFTQQLDMSRRFNDGKYGVRLNVLNRGSQEDAYKNESNSANTVFMGLTPRGTLAYVPRHGLHL